MEITAKLTTPMQGQEVVIKTVLNAAEREQVQTAQMRFVNTKDGQDIHVTDMGKMTLAEKHELIKVSLVSIDGDETSTFERWHKMYEHDAAYVYEKILDAQKKMIPSTSPTSS